MKFEKITLKKLQERWDAELVNILDKVESGDLDIYVRHATWKNNCCISERKDAISLHLLNENIKTELNNFKVKKEQLNYLFLKDVLENKFFSILAPGYEVKNKNILQSQNISNCELFQKLYEQINHRTLDALMSLNSKYTEELLKPTFKSSSFITKKNRQLHKKIKIIDKVIEDIKINNASNHRDATQFLPHPLEYNISPYIFVFPRIQPVSEPIKFNNIYFLEEDILALEKPKRNSTLDNRKAGLNKFLSTYDGDFPGDLKRTEAWELLTDYDIKVFPPISLSQIKELFTAADISFPKK